LYFAAIENGTFCPSLTGQNVPLQRSRSALPRPRSGAENRPPPSAPDPATALAPRRSAAPPFAPGAASGHNPVHDSCNPAPMARQPGPNPALTAH